MQDEDDYYDPHEDERGYSDDDDDDDGIVDFVVAVRSKLNAEQNKKISDDAILIQLENDDFSVDKTLRVIRDRLKAPVKANATSTNNSSNKKSNIADSSLQGKKYVQKSDNSKASTAPIVISTNVPVSLPVVKASTTSSSNTLASKRHSNVTIVSPNDLDLSSPETSISAKGVASAATDTGESHFDATAEQEATLVVVGHVDAGKSTLVGHLLQKCGEIQARVVQKYEQAAQSIGKATFGLAWVMDQREDEREHGVTIDIAERRFQTSRRKYVIVDTPGHRDFIPNMIKGATQADIALLLLPAKTGEYESSMTDTAQTKEHCFLLKSMGVHHIVLVVNKMDQTESVAWKQSRYIHIVQDMLTFLTRDLQFPASHIHCVPVSGLSGENLVDISSESVRHDLNWYIDSTDSSNKMFTGKTLVGTLDGISLPSLKQAAQKPFRAVGTLHDTTRGKLEVRVVQGEMEIGQKVGLAVMLPGIMMAGASLTVEASIGASGEPLTGTLSSCRLYSGIVKQIQSVAGENTTGLNIIGPRDHVNITVEFFASSLAGIQYAASSSSGHMNPFAEELSNDMEMVLFRGPTLPCQTRSFLATVVLMPLLREAILPGTNCELYLQGVEMPCKIAALLSVTLKSTVIDTDGNEKPAVQLRPKILKEGGRTATVRIDVASTSGGICGKHEIIVDRFSVCRALGRFALRAKGFTLAVGIIDDVVSN